MKERPILFSASMVRAILDGSKMQTRRVMKPQPPGWMSGIGQKVFDCPYGQPGDRLWVRESFWGCDLPGYSDQPCVVYDDEWHGKEYRPAEARPWARKFGRIPSIHMPRDCSRILLEIVSVRVERLQDISEQDAWDEGVQDWMGKATPWIGVLAPVSVHAYATLWEQINGAGSWNANPWVWVIEFKRVTP
jgi:hypothetical protein